MKSKFNPNLLAGFFTIFFLTGAILSCSSGNGDDGAPPAGPPPTVPAVVFIADKDTDGVNELYAALNDGASVVKLSGPMVPGQNVIDFKISPDGTRVAYRANQDDPNVIELYVNNMSGGTPIKVSGSLAPNGNVEVLPALTFDAFGWSPDSSMIAYIADQNVGVGDVYELFVSTPDGLDNFQVSGALVAGGLVLEFEWAPDSSRIAYRATQDIPGVRELYTNLPTASSTAVKVSTPLGGGSDVDAPLPTKDAFQWAPNSSRIAYLADVTNGPFELYTTLPDGSGIPIKVSADLSGSFNVNEFKWSPDSSRIAYLADQNTDDVFELYTTNPLAISDFVKVSVTPVGDVWDYEWAPDSSLVAYRADEVTATVRELYSAPGDGGAARVEVSGLPDPATFLATVSSFEWAPDSSSIAYIADQEEDDIFELFTAERTSIAPPVFSTPIRIHPDFTGSEDVLESKWAPDNTRIAYIANQDPGGLFELYSSLPDGSVNDKVSGPLTANGARVFEFEWAPDISRIAYRAIQEKDFVAELYSSLPDGSGNGNISGTLVSGGNVAFGGFEYEP